MSAAFGRPWTPAEDDVIRKLYRKKGGLWLTRKLDRTAVAIRHRANDSGVTAARRWSDIERRRLRNWWGQMPVKSIALRLERNIKAVYCEGRKMGLPTGATEGTEIVGHAAKRLGYDRESLCRILKWAGVEVTRATCKPWKSERHVKCVDSFEATEAVKRWLETEVLAEAARSRGISTWRLVVALRAAGVEKPIEKWKTWRIETAVIDRALVGEGRRAA